MKSSANEQNCERNYEVVSRKVVIVEAFVSSRRREDRSLSDATERMAAQKDPARVQQRVIANSLFEMEIIQVVI